MFDLRRFVPVLSGVLLAASLGACSDPIAPARRPCRGEAPSRVAGASDPTQPAELSIPGRRAARRLPGRQHRGWTALAGTPGVSAVLQRELAADGMPFRLVNAGVSGDTSAGGPAAHRLDPLAETGPCS
jgi:hypothetical protein